MDNDQKQSGEDIQNILLSQILRENEDTEFGRVHGFRDIQNYEEYGSRVPLQDYEELRPYIASIISGRENILFPGSVYKFVTSSGSVANPKILPLTKKFVNRSFKPFFKTYVSNLMREEPGLIANFNNVLNLKWDAGRRKPVLSSGDELSGLSQIDFSTDFSDTDMMEPGTNSPWSHVPSEIESDLDRLYARLRLAAEHDIRYVIGINPRFIANAALLLDERCETLFTDLESGLVLGESHIGLQPNSALADELRARVSGTGTLRPRDVWPNIEGLVCWDGSIPELYLDRVRKWFGETTKILPAPLALSEANLAIPCDFQNNYQILCDDLTFFEFKRIGASEGPIFAGFETLVEGACYEIFVTTFSGLYRYRTGDVLRVHGFEGGVPLVRYVGRSNIETSHGIQEDILLECLKALDAQFNLGLSSAFFGTQSAPSEGLDLYVECVGVRDDEDQIENWLNKILTTALSEAGYPISKRAVSVRFLSERTFYRDWKRQIDNGSRPPQVKDKILRDAAELSGL